MEKDNINFRANNENVDFVRVFTTKCPMCKHEHIVKYYYTYETTQFTDPFFTNLVTTTLKREKLVKTEKINKSFKKIEVADISEESNETIMIMVCPKCGVIADYETCTKFEEEKIRK